jgi:MraZ protein
MFRGRYEHSVDPKGRIALPSAWKRSIVEKGEGALVITTHLSEPCLVAYPEEEWSAFEDRLSKLPQFDPSVMKLRRLYVGGAMDCPSDKQGRVLIPTVLREYAALEKEIYWVGAIKTIEIWSKAKWNERVESSRQTVTADDLAKLGELGI